MIAPTDTAGIPQATRAETGQGADPSPAARGLPQRRGAFCSRQEPLRPRPSIHGWNCRADAPTADWASMLPAKIRKTPSDPCFRLHLRVAPDALEVRGALVCGYCSVARQRGFLGVSECGASSLPPDRTVLLTRPGLVWGVQAGLLGASRPCFQQSASPAVEDWIHDAKGKAL